MYSNYYSNPLLFPQVHHSSLCVVIVLTSTWLVVVIAANPDQWPVPLSKYNATVGAPPAVQNTSKALQPSPAPFRRNPFAFRC